MNKNIAKKLAKIWEKIANFSQKAMENTNLGIVLVCYLSFTISVIVRFFSNYALSWLFAVVSITTHPYIQYLLRRIIEKIMLLNQEDLRLVK